MELARELGARRAAAQQRRRTEGREAAGRAGQQVGHVEQGVRAPADTGGAGGPASTPPPRGGYRVSTSSREPRTGLGEGEAMAVGAQSARADGGYGEARLPINPSPFGDG